MKPGIYKMTNQEYHKAPGISASHFKELLKSPAHYQAWLTAEREPTEEMLIGSLVHCMILEPEIVDKEFVVEPKCDKRTKEGKAIYAKFLEEINGRKAIHPEIYALCEQIADSIRTKISNGKHKKYLEGLKEYVFFWNDPKTGLLCKCKPDCLTPSGITDLKVVKDASEQGFQYSVAKSLYFIQAAFYLTGIRLAVEQSGIAYPGALPDKFTFMAVEKDGPLEVGLYECDPNMIQFGLNQVEKLLFRYKQCSQSNSWPGYSDKVKVITLPNWALYQFDYTKE